MDPLYSTVPRALPPILPPPTDSTWLRVRAFRLPLGQKVAQQGGAEGGRQRGNTVREAQMTDRQKEPHSEAWRISTGQGPLGGLELQ